jgi:hypothetical protein
MSSLLGLTAKKCCKLHSLAVDLKEMTVKTLEFAFKSIGFQISSIRRGG